MALENPLWGQERIANELWVKLGLRVSPRTPGVGTRETVHLMDSCVGGVVSVLGKITVMRPSS